MRKLLIAVLTAVLLLVLIAIGGVLYIRNLEPAAENRVAPRISGIFRHHNYRLSVPVVKAVQSTL